MGTQNPKIISKDLLNELYASGKSMAEIASQLRCSIHKVVYWMNNYNIERRKLSDAMYYKLNPHGDPFKIKDKLSTNDTFLLGLGIGIYWEEGTKVNPHALRVTNTDPHIILTFKKFLKDICQVHENKILYSLVCFNDSNPNAVIDYWIKHLKISQEKFGKIVQIPTQGKGTYKKKSQFGVCAITVCNIKLKEWMMKQIENVGKT